MANKYSIYDPGVDAYREVSAAKANEFVNSAEAVKAQLIANGDRT